MDGENKSSVQDDPLLNRISESTDDSEGVTTQLPSAASQRHDFLFKIAILGNSGSGKTCLLKRFTDDSFSASPFLPTIGIDFRTKIISVDERMVKLQVWDTAGKSRFESLGEMFLSEAMGVIFCFDITDKKSFTNLPHWMSKFIGKPKKHSSNQVPCAVVGCKSDLGDEKRMITKYEGQKFAVKHGAKYLETSAKLNTGIDELFQSLASSILSNTLKSLQDISNSNSLGVQKCSTEDNDVLMRSAGNRRSLRDWSNNISVRGVSFRRSVRRSFRVMSQKKKKKEKKRNASDVGISIAKANIEGNDEARALTASIRSSQQLGERVSISSTPLPTENEISHVSDEKTNNKIDDDEDFKPKFKFCCM